MKIVGNLLKTAPWLAAGSMFLFALALAIPAHADGIVYTGSGATAGLSISGPTTTIDTPTIVYEAPNGYFDWGFTFINNGSSTLTVNENWALGNGGNPVAGTDLTDKIVTVDPAPPTQVETVPAYGSMVPEVPGIATYTMNMYTDQKADFGKDAAEWVYVVNFYLNGSQTPFYTTNEYVNVVDTVPEPGSLILLGTGLAGLAGMLRRRFIKA